MFTVGIDPGITTGVAFYDPELTKSDPRRGIVTHSSKDPSAVAAMIKRETENDRIELVVVEGFFSGGALTRAGHTTIEYVGYFKGYCKDLGLPLIVHHASARLGTIQAAKNLIKGHDLGPVTIHEIDALSHAIRARAMHQSRERRTK